MVLRYSDRCTLDAKHSIGSSSRCLQLSAAVVESDAYVSAVTLIVVRLEDPIDVITTPQRSYVSNEC